MNQYSQDQVQTYQQGYSQGQGNLPARQSPTAMQREQVFGQTRQNQPAPRLADIKLLRADLREKRDQLGWFDPRRAQVDAQIKELDSLTWEMEKRLAVGQVEREVINYSFQQGMLLLGQMGAFVEMIGEAQGYLSPGQQALMALGDNAVLEHFQRHVQPLGNSFPELNRLINGS